MDGHSISYQCKRPTFSATTQSKTYDKKVFLFDDPGSGKDFANFGVFETEIDENGGLKPFMGLIPRKSMREDEREHQSQLLKDGKRGMEVWDGMKEFIVKRDKDEHTDYRRSVPEFSFTLSSAEYKNVAGHDYSRRKRRSALFEDTGGYTAYGKEYKKAIDSVRIFATVQVSKIFFFFKKDNSNWRDSRFSEK